MEYQEVKEWLDAIVDTIERQLELEYLSDIVKTHRPNDHYFISHGIEIVADILGLQLKHREFKDCEFRHHYIFTYRGIVFLQCESEPLEGVVYENV